MVRLGLELLTVLLLLQGVVQIIFVRSHLACPLPPSTTIVITVRVAGSLGTVPCVSLLRGELSFLRQVRQSSTELVQAGEQLVQLVLRV